MVSKLKRVLFAAMVALVAVVIAVTVFSYARTRFDAGATAEAADYGWQPSVRLKTGIDASVISSYETINQPVSLTGTDDKTIYYFVRIDSDALKANNTFKYTKSATKLEGTQLESATWITVTSANKITETEDGVEVDYLYVAEDVNNDFSGYVYFRREYSVTESGITKKQIENYPSYVALSYTVPAGDYKPEIKSVVARVAGGGEYTGGWLSGGLTFEVTTELMSGGKAFDSAKEMLFYSIDNGTNFIPIKNSNTVLVENRALSSVNVIFKLTDNSGGNENRWVYGTHAGEYPVKMDPYKPEFSVTAETMDLEGRRTDYVSGSWTSKQVTFSLQNISRCCSEVRYTVSVNGREYAEASDVTTFTETTSDIKFMAYNEAGTSFTYNTVFAVNIDATTPVANVTATTPDPDDESKQKVLTATKDTNGTISFGFANGSIEVYAYNRDASGKAISNPSGTEFQYQRKIDGMYSGNWSAMTKQVRSDSGETGYVLTATSGDKMSVTFTYKFRIRSKAGLVSDETEVTFTVVKSAYLIELGDVTAEMNSLGWIADKAVVRVSVPTDSVRGADGKYVTPTAKYDFYYKASNSAEAESRATGRAVEFHEEKENEVRWWYEFDLVASADSTFTIYARNAAGKRSANTETTEDKIRIDVLDPVFVMSAYVYPTVAIPSEDMIVIDVENPGWVNGQIMLVLKVREGVSGIYVRELVYATEGGKILRDETTGEIIWQPRNVKMESAESITEEDAYGVSWNWSVYRITINAGEVDESGFYNGSREYRYRVYTNSGKYVDAAFTANIDTSDRIAMTEFTVSSGKKAQDVTITGASGQRFIDVTTAYGFSVCEETFLDFTTSIDKLGVDKHYVLRYQFFNGDGMDENLLMQAASSLIESNFVTLRAGKLLPITIADNAVGDVYVAVFIDSDAQAYDGKRVSAGPYVIKLHYDTKNLVINYELTAENSTSGGTVDLTEDMQAGKWVKGKISVKINVKTNEEGGVKLDDSYTFYYMLLDSITEGIPDDRWIEIENGILNDNGSYEFYVPFIDEGFSGYVTVSVCNGAGYRSRQEASMVTKIKIDNTTPDPDEAIIYDKGTGENYVDGVRGDKSSLSVSTGTGSTTVDVFTYYGTSKINLRKVADASRSEISFYYAYLGQEVTAVDLAETAFTKLGDETVDLFAAAGITLSKTSYSTAYFALYAVNEVGTEAPCATKKTGGVITVASVYRFVSDPSEMTGSVTFSTSDGTYSDQTGMFTYLWKEQIVIYMNGKGSVAPDGEENYMTVQFSVDKGLTWFDYLDAGATKVWYASGENNIPLTFSPDLFADYVDENGKHPFANGVNCAFMFRLRNKAGATRICGNAYIAMENTVPEFRIITLDKDNAEYRGGETDLAKAPSKWTSGPVTVKIETITMPASGITYMYYLEYSDGATVVSTAEDGTYGKKLTNYSSFSTDTLDGFNLNRDAILTITAVSNSSSERIAQQKVRIAVDQITPEFTLGGEAFNTESSLTELISSGQWTNKNRVSITKARVATNVSEVSYFYTIKYKDGSSVEEVPTEWSDSLGTIEVSRSCTFTVTATNGSGLTCTKEFVVNIDTTPPVIRFDGGMNVIPGEEYFIDLRVYVEEANIDICEYITIKDDTRGFAFAPKGYILSTSSVDNSTRYDKNGKPYRGYVKVYVKDYAGNEASIEFYVLPFRLTVNNLTLTDEDLAQVDAYEVALNKARNYMEKSRVSYFENLISRLNDRENTLRKEIKGYQDYLEKLYNRSSFELRSDYQEMFRYMETFNDYKVYGQEWIQKAITGDVTSKYYAYYENFRTQFEKLDALMKEVENAENQVIALPAINMVEREDWNDILTVYDTYRNLSMDQKACFKANLYNKLILLKEACEVLLLVDEELGVGINGDFAPGATINVTQYGSSTETFSNAQSLLAKTVSSTKPRTVVSIYRVALEGAYAQTSVSDITVTLPIAEEYRSYIYFSVYELSDDGSMKLVNDTEIQPDGKSIQFKADKLSTYVMCIKAEMSETKSEEGVYGTILGLELDTKMIKYLLIIGAALFAIVLLVVIVLGIRHRRFLNSYNKAYRNSLYRKGVKGIPKGNKM